MVVKFFHLKWW